MKKIIITLMAIFLSFNVSADEFYKNIPDMVRPDLADAYYKAGEGYIKSGQKARGEAFQKMAIRIFPEYNPEKPVTGLVMLPIEAKPDLEGTTSQVEIEKRVRQKKLKVEALVKHQFMKLVRGIVNEDTKLIESIMGKTVYAPEFEEGVDYSVLMEGFPALFNDEDLTSVSPYSIYDFSSMTIGLGPGETYMLRIKTTGQYDQAFSSFFTFWTQEQVFFFGPQDNSWKLIGAGYLPSSF